MKANIKEKKEKKKTKNGQIRVTQIDRSAHATTTDGGKTGNDDSDSAGEYDVSVNYENPYVNENYMDTSAHFNTPSNAPPTHSSGAQFDNDKSMIMINVGRPTEPTIVDPQDDA